MDKIRIAVNEDAFEIAKIHVASWKKIYRGMIPDYILDGLSIKKRAEQWENLIQNNASILLLEKDNHLIGFASYCPARDKDTDPTTGEIAAIYLHPDYWNQGLGKKLCVATLRELRKLGFSDIIVWVMEENIQARQFYQALGFKDENKHKEDPLSACTLGVVSGEKVTENTTLKVKEVRYRHKGSDPCP